jgi:hypothetical protein
MGPGQGKMVRRPEVTCELEELECIWDWDRIGRMAGSRERRRAYGCIG